MGFARRNASSVKPVLSLNDLMLFVSWFKLQQPFRRFNTCETLMTKAVRGTFMSSTAYSGGSAGLSESSDEELSGSNASRGPFGGFGGFGGLGGGSTLSGGAAALATGACGCCCGGASVVPLFPPDGRRGAALSEEPLVDSRLPEIPCPVAAVSPRNRDRGPPIAPGPVRLAFSSFSGGAQSFFSFHPELTKSSDMGLSAGGCLGANAGV
mmetsp:Transcript_60228/g.119460  ORF Transcript_60228/g.119460 Transcript_60228/m.119460 type:complete len:210 (+) Transcript_60228:504-1133(+)